MDGPRHLLLLCLLPLAVLLAGCSSSSPAVRIERADPAPAVEQAEAHAIVTDQPAPVAAPASSGSFRSVPRARTNDDPLLLAAIRRALGAEADDYSVVVRRLTDGRGA